MKNLLNFKIWENLYESDGFGTSPFLLRKEKDVYHYFFNLESKKEDDRGFHLIIGKYSNKEAISGSKNSYCVLGLSEISHEIIDDIAVGKVEDIPGPNSIKFKMDENLTSRILECVSKCILDYLEKNPKVTRIYDEIQENLFFKGKGTYIEYMKSILGPVIGDWGIQEGSDKYSVIISR
jgi:hypothetical protein